MIVNYIPAGIQPRLCGYHYRDDTGGQHRLCRAVFMVVIILISKGAAFRILLLCYGKYVVRHCIAV